MKKIMVVDNDIMMLEFMSDLLEKEGHHVLTAKDGLTALENLETRLPDIMFIDLVMPDIDGERLCRKIRSIPKLNGIYIVILSAIAAEQEIDFTEIGADACIAKGPFDKMSEHILYVLDRLDNKVPDETTKNIIGLEDVRLCDITKELLSSKRHSDAILNNISNGILELNLNNKVVYTNHFAQLLIGIREEDLLGSYFTDLFDDPHKILVKEIIDLIDYGPQKITDDLPLMLTGKIVSMNILPVYDEERKSIIVILNDNTKRKLAEKQIKDSIREKELLLKKLQISKESFNSLVENETSGMIVIRKNGIICFVNPAARRLFNRGNGELIGEAFGIPMTVSDDSMEIDIVRKGGTKGVGNMQIFETEWEGEGAHMLLIHDVTDQKLYEESLIKAAEESKRLDVMKSEFISIASHELRTPLTSTKNAVDIIMKGKAGAITHEQERFLSMAQRNIERLGTLINDMLNISKIESGTMDFQYNRMDIRKMIADVINMVQASAGKKRIALNQDIFPDLPAIYGDTDKIEAVLINLIGNAIKFTPEQGSVNIGVHKREAVSDMPEEAMGYVEVSVADTGIGIPEEHGAHLFEKFYQVKHSLAKQDQSIGSGLGLAICKGIVERHKGKIWYESTEGEGSTFHFSLPVFSPQTVEATVLEKMALAYLNSPLYSLMEVNLDQEALTSLNLQAPEVVEKFRCQLIDVIREGIHRDGDRIIFNPVSCGFVIILDKTPKEKAMTVRKNLEEVLSRHPIFFAGTSLAVPTVSEPVAFPEDGVTMEELLEAVKKQRIDSLLIRPECIAGSSATT